MTSAMGIRKTLKRVLKLAEVSQQNQETAYAMLYRIEQELRPPTVASMFKTIGESIGADLTGNAPRPLTIYTMVKALYDGQQRPESGTADAVREVRNRLYDHTQTTARKLNVMDNTLARLADKLQSYEPTKEDVRERDGLTNGMAKLRADVNRILSIVGRIERNQRDPPPTVTENSVVNRLDALQNQLAELRAEHHAAATAGEPVKAIGERLDQLERGNASLRALITGVETKLIDAHIIDGGMRED